MGQVEVFIPVKRYCQECLIVEETCMQEEDDLKKYIAELLGCVKKLREIGLVVIDELLVILLLYSLPDFFARQWNREMI